MVNSSLVESIKHEALALELWLAEAERRDTEMESGDVKGINGEQLFASIESRHAM